MERGDRKDKESEEGVFKTHGTERKRGKKERKIERKEKKNERAKEKESRGGGGVPHGEQKKHTPLKNILNLWN